jgi:hypothetical protein
LLALRKRIDTTENYVTVAQMFGFLLPFLRYGQNLCARIHTFYNSADYVGLQSAEPSVTGSCTNHPIQVPHFDVIVINNDEVPGTNVSQLQRNMRAATA